MSNNKLGEITNFRIEMQIDIADKLLRETSVRPVDAERFLRDLLNDVQEPYKIGGATYYAGDILEQVDPVHFRCAVADEVSFRLEEGEWTEIAGGYYDTWELEKLAEPCEQCSDPCLFKLCSCTGDSKRHTADDHKNSRPVS